MSKYIDADAVDKVICKKIENTVSCAEHNALIDVKFDIEELPAADVEPARHGLIDRAKKYAADMEKRYTDVCADFRERTGQDYVCGACKYNDCAYVGADGDWCGECPGFESNECFVLSDELKRKIWEIVDIVSGAKMDGGSE